MNIASIDIGSNTVLLLIARINSNNIHQFETIMNKYRAPRLGRGIDSEGKISPESLQIFYTVLDEYSSTIKEQNCETVIAYATAAMRNAKNSSEIKEHVKRNYDIDIQIINGETEAYLSYLGAASVLKSENEKIVIDIGGGSTEIIFGCHDELKFRKSFKIGTVTLTERFISSELPTDDELIEMKSYCSEIFAELPASIPMQIPAIAVAGTPTSLSCMNLGLRNYHESEVEGSTLNTSQLDKLINDLKILTPGQRLKIYGEVINGREDVIFSGAVLLRTIAELLNIHTLHVTGKGIRYGAVVDYLLKHK